MIFFSTEIFVILTKIKKKKKKKKKILGKKPQLFWSEWLGGSVGCGQSNIFFSCLMDQNSQNIVLTNNSRTAWPTQILMLFLRSLDNFIDAYYFSNRNDREGWLAVDNQTFFFFFFFCLMDQNSQNIVLINSRTALIDLLKGGYAYSNMHIFHF